MGDQHSPALYVYCVVPAADPMPPLSSPALDGGVVRAVRHGELAALVHTCPPEPYRNGGEKAREWVVAHNAVVEEAWGRAGAVLPMSFNVIVRGDGERSAEANLVEWLATHHEALRGRLEALTSQVELGVKILWNVEALTASLAGGERPEDASARGRSYFVLHQARRRLKDELEARAEADRTRYYRALAALADEVEVSKPKPVEGRQDERRMVLNLSLLISREAVSRVGKYLEGVSREPGVEVRFTGPWPPYSFAGTFGALDRLPSRAGGEAGPTAGGA